MVRLKQATLFLLPFTALHPGFNLTLGDVGLLCVLALEAPRLRLGQPVAAVMVLMAGALTLLGSVLLPLVTTVAAEPWQAAQAVVLLLLVLPFGWILARDLNLRQIAYPLALSAALQGAFAIAQALQPGLRLSTQLAPGLGDLGFRPVGLTTNPNSLGLVMTWSLPFCLYAAMKSPTRVRHLMWSFASMLCAVGGFISLSKLTLVGIPLVAAATLLGIRGRRAGPWVIAGMGGLYLALREGPVLDWLTRSFAYRFSTSESFSVRLSGIQEAWRHLSEWALLGIGAGRDTLYGPWGTNIHNQMVGYAVQFGIPVALLIAGYKIVLSIEALRRGREESARLILIVFLAAEATLLFHPTYWIRAHSLPLLLLAALVNARSASGSSRGNAACVA